MTKARRFAIAALVSSVVLSAVSRVEPLFKWIPQPAQDRIWRAMPDLASVAVALSMLCVIALTEVGAPRR